MSPSPLPAGIPPRTKGDACLHAILGRAAGACGLVPAALGVLALAGWLSGALLLASVRPGYIPMAPSTALAFVLLGGSLLLTSRSAHRRLTRAWVIASGTGVLAVSAIILGQFVAGALDTPAPDVESVLVAASGLFGAVPSGRMSPTTAAALCVASVSLLLAVGHGKARRSAGMAGLLVVLAGLVVVLGYLYGTPLLYGGDVIPMALTTAAGFVGLGLGLVALAGPDSLPLRLFTGRSVRPQLLRTFLPVAVGVILAHGVVYRLLVVVTETYALLLAALVAALLVGVGVSLAARAVAARIERADEEVRRAGLFLDSVVENIPHMIFVKDAQELRFVRFNRAGEELLGCPRSEILGKNDRDLFPKEQADFFIAKDREVLSGRVLIDIHEEPLQSKGREVRYLHTMKVPLLDERGEPRYLLGISEDITERKRLDAAKSEFISLVSHQLRTPLTAIRWSLDLMADPATGLTEAQKPLLRDALTGAVHMAQTINVMLRASQIESGALALRPVETDLAALLRQVRADHAAPPAKQLRMTFSCPEGLTLRTDPQILGEILGNLVDNAIRYTPDGGSIDVQVQQTAGGVALTVADTDLGIPMAERDKVFTKLFRASNAVALDPAGTGLGLYVASRLASLLCGSLSFEPGQPRGTRFILHLAPTHQPDAQDSADR